MTVDNNTRVAIREAFRTGQLRVRAVDPCTGTVGLHIVGDVLKHYTPHKDIVRIVLMDGREVETTPDHSLFLPGVLPVETGSLREGDAVVTVGDDDSVTSTVVIRVETRPPDSTGCTYDLAVPGPENFVLANGILAHNSYSIGGISLDIDKSSKYMDIKRNAEEQWDKMVEAKKMTTLYFRGLKQPKFGQGVRSAFGPQVGRGVLSPRNFTVALGCLGGYALWHEVMNHAYNLSLLLS